MSRMRSFLVIPAVVVASFGVACSAPRAAQAQSGAKAGSSPEKIVTLKSLKFTPNKATVALGTKIVFTWKESVAHNIVFDNKGPKSATINKGTWTPDVKYFKKGTYKYKCTLHPGMNGQITFQ